MDYQTRYFDRCGESNTNAVLKLVQDWADRLDIETLVVASTSGRTGLKTVESIRNHRIVVVTHSAGFREEDQQELEDSDRGALEKAGARNQNTSYTPTRWWRQRFAILRAPGPA